MSTNLADPMVDRLVKRRDQALGQIEALKQAAIDGDRDLTETDSEAITEYKRSIGEIDKQLELVGENLRMDDDARNRLALIAPSAKPAPKYRSDGELMYDMLHQGEAESRERYRTCLKRAAEHMGTDAADTSATAGDLKALSVSPITGPVINPFHAAMPFASAIGLGAMPAGSSFERPYIVDADFATGVAEQTAQKAELASKKFDTDTDMLKRTTLGGYLNLSQQLLTWSPGSLGIVVDQMRRRLSAQIEAHLITEIGLSTGKVDLAADADAATTIAAIYTASADVYTATGSLAQWVAVGPGGWARLGSLVDAAGRPLLPTVSPNNALGSASASTFTTSIAGLNVIVTPSIIDDEFRVGNGMCIEGYAYFYPVLEAVEPSVLGRQVAVAADVVAHRPTPYANGVVLVGAP